jgi:hypothetical protein
MATRDEQLAVLAIEVQTDPLGRGYNGAGSENPGPDPMTDEQVTESLNVRNRPTEGGPVSITELYDELIDGGELSDLRTTVNSEFKDMVLLGHNAVNASFEVTSEDYIEIAQIFPGGSQTRTSMNNRVQGFESRGEELGLPRPIKEAWVTEARALDLTPQGRALFNELAGKSKQAQRRIEIIQARLARNL